MCVYIYIYGIANEARQSPGRPTSDTAAQGEARGGKGSGGEEEGGKEGSVRGSITIVTS